MIGRKAYSDPYLLAKLQEQIDLPSTRSGWRAPGRADIVRQMADYAERQLAGGVRLHHITRHMLGLYAGRPGARRWRRFISENGQQPGAGPEVLLDSLRVFDIAA